MRRRGVFPRGVIIDSCHRRHLCRPLPSRPPERHDSLTLGESASKPCLRALWSAFPRLAGSNQARRMLPAPRRSWMNRPILTCVLFAFASAALSAQQASPSTPYEGTSNPPADSTIETSQPDQPKPPAGKQMIAQPPAPRSEEHTSE